MDISDFTVHTNQVPVYDAAGNLIHEITLPEPITPAIGRRGGYGDSGIYYKGAGILYRGHLTNEPTADETILKKNELPYQKYTVVKPNLIKKFGIFQFPHQPAFSDFEGTCGPKEDKLPVYVKNFRYSAIAEITDILDTGLTGQHIYAYRLKELSARPKQTASLLEYILTENYNSAWDKNLWGDITCLCYVRDLADWFQSDRFCHKLGTVYGLLNSIFRSDKYTYAQVTSQILGYHHMDALYLPYVSALIVAHFCPTCMNQFPYSLERLTPELYQKLLLTLYDGKACCHLEQEEPWNWVRDAYKKGLPSQMALFTQELTLSRMRCKELSSLSLNS